MKRHFSGHLIVVILPLSFRGGLAHSTQKMDMLLLLLLQPLITAGQGQAKSEEPGLHPSTTPTQRLVRSQLHQMENGKRSALHPTGATGSRLEQGNAPPHAPPSISLVLLRRCCGSACARGQVLSPFVSRAQEAAVKGKVVASNHVGGAAGTSARRARSGLR